MHYRYLLLFNKEHAETSEEARNFAWDTLHEEGFVGGGEDRFSCSPSDWFVIGGRWSGELSGVGEKNGCKKASSDSYQKLGYEDDAAIVDEEIYEELLKGYEGTPDSDEHADYEYDVVSPEIIGKKWVVVVDYHR